MTDKTTKIPTDAATPSSERRDLDLWASVSSARGRLLPWRCGYLLVSGVVVLILGLAGSANLRYGLVLGTVYGVLIVGNNAVGATLGEINLGAIAFLAVGAYTVTVTIEHGYSVYLAMLLAVVVSAVIGFVLAIPTSRLGGLSAALVTLALAYSIHDLAAFLKPITGGDAGKFVPTDVTFAGLTIAGSEPGMLILAVVVMLLVGLAFLAILNSRAGAIAITVGEASQAASVFATPSRLVKLSVWVWAAAVGGLAGALYAFSVGYVSSASWPFVLSLYVFVGGLIGGTRSPTGAWIGGILVGAVPLWIQNFVPPDATNIVFGVILLIALRGGGKGVLEFAERGVIALMMRRRSTT